MAKEKKEAPFCTPEVLSRIHKVTGQSQGIERMVKAGRPIEPILLQISAVKSALTGLAQELFAMHLANNVEAAVTAKTSVEDVTQSLSSAVQYFCRMK